MAVVIFGGSPRKENLSLLPLIPLLFATPWTVACQAPGPWDFPRQEYWSGLSFPSPGNLPDPGMELTSPTSAGRFFTAEPPGKCFNVFTIYYIF